MKMTLSKPLSPCQTMDLLAPCLGLHKLQNCEKQCLFFKFPVYGNLLQHPELRQRLQLVWFVQHSFQSPFSCLIIRQVGELKATFPRVLMTESQMCFCFPSKTYLCNGMGTGGTVHSRASCFFCWQGQLWRLLISCVVIAEVPSGTTIWWTQ